MSNETNSETKKILNVVLEKLRINCMTVKLFIEQLLPIKTVQMLNETWYLPKSSRSKSMWFLIWVWFV